MNPGQVNARRRSGSVERYPPDCGISIHLKASASSYPQPQSATRRPRRRSWSAVRRAFRARPRGDVPRARGVPRGARVSRRAPAERRNQVASRATWTRDAIRESSGSVRARARCGGSGRGRRAPGRRRDRPARSARNRCEAGADEARRHLGLLFMAGRARPQALIEKADARKRGREKAMFAPSTPRTSMTSSP